jgi:hypothetical protein
VVGYCVLDRNGNRAFEDVEIEPCWLYAKERSSTSPEGMAGIFAGGSVRLGHDLAQRSWIDWPQRKWKSRTPAAYATAGKPDDRNRNN